MITIKAYLYPNTVEVQIMDPTIFTTRNRVVYSRPIKVYQGIDNPIQIVVKNQDQKSVDLSGYSLQVDIQDPTNRVTVNSYGVQYIDFTQGTGTFTLDRLTLDSMEQRFYKLTVKRINRLDNTEQPIYVDDNFGVPLDLEVLPAYYATVEPTPFVDDSVADGGTI